MSREMSLPKNQPKPTAPIQSEKKETLEQKLTRIKAQEQERQAKKKAHEQAKLEEAEQQALDKQLSQDEQRHQAQMALMDGTPLGAIKEMAKLEYENSELKIILVQHTKSCVDLMTALPDLLEALQTHSTQQTQDLIATVNQIKASDKALHDNIAHYLKTLTDTLDGSVNRWLNDNIREAMSRNEASVKKLTDTQLKQIKSVANEYRYNQQRFADIQGFKHFMFWVATASWCVWLLQFLWGFIAPLF